jgi:diaminohydroxyphosphoribosylaminopyrimidine deaminase/5-amino-6-(5-phosphoribosylamino)uracil reductase
VRVEGGAIGSGRQPARVVLDSQFRIPPSAKILRQPGLTLIAGLQSAAKNAEALQQMGAEVRFLPTGPENRVDLHAAIELLGELEFNEVLVEAGATLNGSLLVEGLVDEWIVYLAPCILGDHGRGLFHLPGLQRMADRYELRLTETRQVGADLRMTLRKSL